jgi:hypothetical protein
VKVKGAAVCLAWGAMEGLRTSKRLSKLCLGLPGLCVPRLFSGDNIIVGRWMM